MAEGLSVYAIPTPASGSPNNSSNGNVGGMWPLFTCRTPALLATFTGVGHALGFLAILGLVLLRTL